MNRSLQILYGRDTLHDHFLPTGSFLADRRILIATRKDIRLVGSRRSRHFYLRSNGDGWTTTCMP